MRRLIFSLCVISFQFLLSQQKAIKPKIMIIPSNQWMVENNYVTKTVIQGESRNTYEYEKAFNNDPTLNDVINSVGGIFAERGFTLTNMSAAIQQVKKKTQRNNATGRVFSVLDELANEVSADIRLELDFHIQDVGFGQRQVDRFSLTAIDTYSSENVGDVRGVGTASSETSISSLVQERVLATINELESDILNIFNGYVENGRQIKIEVIFSNVLGLCFDLYDVDEDGLMTFEMFENWVIENSFKGRGQSEPLEESINLILNIPLVNENGKSVKAFDYSVLLLKKLNPKYVLRPENIGLGYSILNINDCR